MNINYLEKEYFGVPSKRSLICYTIAVTVPFNDWVQMIEHTYWMRRRTGYIILRKGSNIWLQYSQYSKSVPIQCAFLFLILDSTLEQKDLLANVTQPTFSRTLIRGRKNTITCNKELQKLEVWSFLKNVASTINFA